MDTYVIEFYYSYFAGIFSLVILPPYSTSSTLCSGLVFDPIEKTIVLRRWHNPSGWQSVIRLWQYGYNLSISSRGSWVRSAMV